MKYESEILYDLMKRDGLLNPSQDNLPYESELKEKYVKDVEGAYPKLQDYRPEWLNYNKCEYIPADFPTESQTNQTSGTFQNVVPFAYDVATLKGLTLVNMCSDGNIKKEIGWSSETQAKYNLNKDMINIDKGYLLIATVTNSTETFYVSFNGGNEDGVTYLTPKQNGLLKAKINFKNTGSIGSRFMIFHLNSSNKNSDGCIENVMLIEYQDGMENWDIPYFDGMKSVQMPVLTTTNGNLLILSPNTLEMGSISGYTGEIVQGNTRCHTTNIKVSQKDDLFLKRINCDYQVAVRYYYDDTLVNRSLNNTGYFINDGNLKVDGGEDYNSIKLIFAKSDNSILTIEEVAKQQIMLVPNNNYTTYEPHQSNILTVNEDVELRGIGDVKDTLDCLTGEVTERITEVVLNGSNDENWKLGTVKENTQVFELILSNAQNINNAIICDKLPTGASGDVEKIVYGDSTGGGSNTSLYIALLKTKASTVNQLKTYLSSNPIVVQYPLKTESTKTVDLSCINENNAECDFIPLMNTMSYQSSSDTIPPLADLTVCIEATTQNLASFVHLEGVKENE